MPRSLSRSSNFSDDAASHPSVPRPRGRPKVMSDTTQAEHIRGTARALFIEQGYGGTTMSHVAARCKISKRTLYRHFPGKTELLAAVIDLHRTSMLALPGDYDELPLTEALEKIFLIDIDAEADAERTAFLKLAMVESVRDPQVGELMHRLGADRSRMLLAEWLDAQQQKGRLQVDDTSSAAGILMDMIFGAVVTKTGNGPEWPGADARRLYLRRCIHIFVHGVG
ncbi:TetR family transcriptional regulator [Pararhizobium polonicum]|uniref:TetR family transcriptional regulator n=2 Tax=Pararhizobium polonicum TaxID=1612624 RepID=A0A1C7P1E4_9HYPH|nr:TetR family transcriptional regulator [Pararhizobium polonicum]